ncbi:uncharacterized protein LOC143598304 [Bidens hawaiensis]|uniref:uncharacterized protein LOC143598304 n=1 Tax=Bidens hawaiensis TaxID=980011 RepID=UPI004049992F
MNTNTALHHFLLLLILTVVSTAAQQPAGGCADSVISFSPCLPYISAPPNDLADEPSPQCCDIFNGAFDSDDAECLCYLVPQNSLLGFPLNVTKLLSLSTLCSLNNTTDTATNNSSLQSLCSDSPTLPPMIATPRRPPISGSDAQHLPPPPHVPLFHPPPPSTITMPRPPADNNASAETPAKPPTSDQSNEHDDMSFWIYAFGFMYFMLEVMGA